MIRIMTRQFVITTATLTGIIGVLLGILCRCRAPASAPPTEAELRTAAAEPAAISESPVVPAAAPRRSTLPTSPRGSIPRSSTSTPPRARGARAGWSKKARGAARSTRSTSAVARRRAAARDGHRLPDRRRGPHPDEPPRDRRRRAAHGEAGRRAHAPRRRGRVGSGHRHRADQGPGAGPFPHAILGDSARLRVGEWVCAIGNPLAYEHTVTVGVVSFIGRKLFDPSLDNYIQTDAAISFGNSGGPLINSRGQVIGINSAISRQASNIGFAVPINQARAVLPQLKKLGRVERGYIGVTLRDVDPDLQSSLKLARADGALVQDVTAGSPGARVGLRPYDVIVSFDGAPVRTQDRLIREIADAQPGSTARLEYVRDGRAQRRHGASWRSGRSQRADRAAPAAERSTQRTGPGELGLSLIEIDDSNAHRFDIPSGMTGLMVQRVEPLSVAYDGGIERGAIILEINRQPVNSVAGFRRIVGAAPPGRRAGVLSLRARSRSARDPHRSGRSRVEATHPGDRRRGGDPRLVEDDARVRRLRGDAGRHRRRRRQAGRARSARSGVSRHQDARHGRPRSAAEAAAHGRDDADRRHLRPRRHHDRGRGDAAGRVRFHREAARPASACWSRSATPSIRGG